MRVRVFAFGKLKTSGLREAADYYLKLVRSFVPIEEIELKPIPVPNKSPATRREIQTKEAEIVTSKASHGGRTPLFLLDEGGRALSTDDWAKLVRDLEQEGVSEACFCVGSSLGFSDTLRSQARGILSLGPQTLPHELARVVLFEQIYRAWSVVRGHPYHNPGA